MSYEFLETDPDCWAARHLRREAKNKGWDPEKGTLKDWLENEGLDTRVSRQVIEGLRTFEASVPACRTAKVTGVQDEEGEVFGRISLTTAQMREEFLNEDGDINEEAISSFVDEYMDTEDGAYWEEVGDLDNVEYDWDNSYSDYDGCELRSRIENEIMFAMEEL